MVSRISACVGASTPEQECISRFLFFAYCWINVWDMGLFESPECPLSFNFLMPCRYVRPIFYRNEIFSKFMLLGEIFYKAEVMEYKFKIINPYPMKIFKILPILIIVLVLFNRCEKDEIAEDPIPLHPFQNTSFVGTVLKYFPVMATYKDGRR